MMNSNGNNRHPICPKWIESLADEVYPGPFSWPLLARPDVPASQQLHHHFKWRFRTVQFGRIALKSLIGQVRVVIY